MLARGLTQKAGKRRDFQTVARPALRDGFERGCSFEEACRFAVARYVSHYVEIESLGHERAMQQADEAFKESAHVLAASWSQWTY